MYKLFMSDRVIDCCLNTNSAIFQLLVLVYKNNWSMVWLEFYFLFIKFPLKFKRTGSAYILFYFFILFICVFLLFLYNSVIPFFTEPVFVSSKTISYKETHHFYQNKILKIKKTLRLPNSLSHPGPTTT